MPDWQQIVTILIALLAAGWLLRRAIVSLRTGKTGCGSCSGCPESAEPETLPVRKQLYSLDSPSGLDRRTR